MDTHKSHIEDDDFGYNKWLSAVVDAIHKKKLLRRKIINIEDIKLSKKKLSCFLVLGSFRFPACACLPNNITKHNYESILNDIYKNIDIRLYCIDEQVYEAFGKDAVLAYIRLFELLAATIIYAEKTFVDENDIIEDDKIEYIRYKLQTLRSFLIERNLRDEADLLYHSDVDSFIDIIDPK